MAYRRCERVECIGRRQLPFPLIDVVFFPFTPACVLVEIEARGAFLLFSAEAGTLLWIPNLCIIVLDALLLFVDIVALASALFLHVRLFAVAMLKK